MLSLSFYYNIERSGFDCQAKFYDRVHGNSEKGKKQRIGNRKIMLHIIAKDMENVNFIPVQSDVLEKFFVLN